MMIHDDGTTTLHRRVYRSRNLSLGLTCLWAWKARSVAVAFV